LDALDFKKLIEVKKTRKAWRFMDTEVSLDTVEDLGEYLEVEYKSSLTDIAEVRVHLHKVVENLGAKKGLL